MKFIGAHIFDYDATFRGDVTIEGNLTISNSVSQNISFGDSDSLYFGNSNDIEIVHVNDQSFIINNTGDLIFDQRTDDRDIIFKCDDGSGGTTTYITLDGSHTKTVFSKETLHNDNIEAKFGDGIDLRIFSDGTDASIKATNGDLYIVNTANDKDIIFQSDDGSGGVANYFKLSGITSKTIFSKTLNLQDSVNLYLGTGNDLQLVHNSVNSEIVNATGNLTIKNTADDKDIIFQSDDGSGGVTGYFFLDGSQTRTQFDKDIMLIGGSSYIFVDNSAGKMEFADGVFAVFGNGSDLELLNDGNDSFITARNTDLKIQQLADDKDIKFFCDDGSGGVTEYLALDGSAVETKFNKDLRIIDNEKLILGSSNDIELFHNGTNNTFNVYTGNLEINQNVADKDIILKADDGSGSATAYITLDGSATATTIHKNLIFDDNISAVFGPGFDLNIRHLGSHSEIQNDTGNLEITQRADDCDIIFECDDGSGGTTAYITLDGSNTRTLVHQHLNLEDSVILQIGSSQDLKLFHSGTSSFISQEGVGDLYIRNIVDDKDVVFQSDDGSGGVANYITLDGSATRTVFSKEANFEDSVKLTFGAQPGGDLQIYHDGSNSYIDEPGTGALNIRSNSVVAGKYTGEVLFRGTADGAFEAFYDNSIKLSTTSTGIDVSGAIEMDKSLTMSHTSDPSDPATGKSVIWSNTDGDLKIKINVGGTVVTRTLATFSD